MASRVALLGFGTVGRSVARILAERHDAPARLTHIFNRGVARKRVGWIANDVIWTERIDDVLDAGVDIIVELLGGLEPAGTWVRRALESGIAVVTANKPLVAEAGVELSAIARRTGAQLAFEASVAGGVPILCGLQDGLSADRLVQILGVLNGTCNYILTRIEATGVRFEAALQEAKDLGFAEADPTDDIEGYDARDKLVILVRLGLRQAVARARVPCVTIAGVRRCDFDLAHRLGCTIRQVSRAEPGSDPGVLSASVRPAFVPQASPLGAMQGSQNIVQVTGTFGGMTSFVGLGAGGDPTAVAVASDVLAIAGHRRTASAWSPPLASPVGVADDFQTPHCVRVRLMGDRAPADLVRELSAQGIDGVEILETGPAPEDEGIAGLHVPAGPTDCLERALDRRDAAVVFPVLTS